MTKSEVIILTDYKKKKYELVPPEGGWGYLVALCIVVTFSTTFIPVVAFGIIFGKFLESFGDEASGTGLVNGVYLAFQWCSGIIANPLLQKMSYRNVGLLGTFLFLAGAFSTIFVGSINQLLISFSVLQGLGFGLILTSTLTAFNLYFEKRRYFVFSVCMVLLLVTNVTYPSLCTYCMNNYGFRGTLLIVAAIPLNCLPAILCLHPVRWHLKKQIISDIIEDPKVETKLISDDKYEYQEKISLLQSKKEEYEKQILEKFIADSSYLERNSSVCSDVWKRVVKYFDLGLFLDAVYVNTVIGLAFCLSSDYIFLTVLPLVLTNLKMNSDEITILLTIFYTSDLVGRFLYAILNAFTHIEARKLTFIATILAVVFRIMFVSGSDFWWLAVFIALTGSIRCFFQSNYSLIISDLYKERFVTAFSLFLVVCGIISLLSGMLIGIVKTATQSNVMVVHLLSAMYGICAVTWSIEFVYKRLRTKNT